MNKNINKEELDKHKKSMLEKFKTAPELLADVDLLEILLYYSTRGKPTDVISSTLINSFGNFSNVIDAFPKDLLNIRELGEHSAALLKLIAELARRYALTSKNTKNLRSVNDAVKYILYSLFSKQKECLFVVFLDEKFRVLGDRIITEGTLTGVTMHPREIVSFSLKYNANKIIISHNHPTGSPRPSFFDKQSTSNLASILTEMEIHLLDHIIVSQYDFHSFYLAKKYNNPDLLLNVNLPEFNKEHFYNEQDISFF